jgi:hypothetical protein
VFIVLALFKAAAFLTLARPEAFLAGLFILGFTD